MDPTSALTTLLQVAKHLYDLSQDLKYNSEECARLSQHVQAIHGQIVLVIGKTVPVDLARRLDDLTDALHGVANTVENLKGKPYLKRLLWAKNISERIRKAYTTLDSSVQLFNVGNQISMRQFQQESQEARDADAEKMRLGFEAVLHNDHDILGLLELQRAEMQEAMLTMQKRIKELPQSLERQFLERGLHAIQRVSGRPKYEPANHIVTSLEIIIDTNRKLGSGGFGEVYECDWRGARVAVKILDKSIPESMVLKEVNTWKHLRHPNILEFYGACPLSSPPFLICALKGNGDALNYLRLNPNSDRAKILHDASLGLVYLHANSIIHRDLKATNILIDEHGRACLSDFGLSEIKVHTTMVTARQSSQPVQGSVRWMAPEQLVYGSCNKATDVYSFGMTMQEVFTGQPPFSGTLDHLLLTLVVDRDIRPLRPDNKAMTDTLWKLVQKCWDKDPANRPLSEDVASELELCATINTPTPSDPIVGLAISSAASITSPKQSAASSPTPSMPVPSLPSPSSAPSVMSPTLGVITTASPSSNTSRSPFRLWFKSKLVQKPLPPPLSPLTLAPPKFPTITSVPLVDKDRDEAILGYMVKLLLDRWGANVWSHLYRLRKRLIGPGPFQCAESSVGSYQQEDLAEVMELFDLWSLHKYRLAACQVADSAYPHFFIHVSLSEKLNRRDGADANKQFQDYCTAMDQKQRPKYITLLDNLNGPEYGVTCIEIDRHLATSHSYRAPPNRQVYLQVWAAIRNVWPELPETSPEIHHVNKGFREIYEGFRFGHLVWSELLLIHESPIYLSDTKVEVWTPAHEAAIKGELLNTILPELERRIPWADKLDPKSQVT